MASDAQLPSNEYNERYSRKVPIQLGDLEQFVMAFGVVDDYIEWMRFFKGVDIPGNGPAVIKQLKEARTLALALYNAPPPSETGERRFTGPGYVLDTIRTLATADSLIDKPTATERIKLIADLCATILSPSEKAGEVQS